MHSMRRFIIVFLLALSGIFIIDQSIKQLFLDGFRYYTNCIDLILVYNKGVAFSMFAFLQEYLKYIQIVLLVGVTAYIFSLKKFCYAFPAGILLGAGISNVYDRFIHEGVVDMVYWHCGFNFAVFNFADVMIDLAVVWFLVLNFKPRFCNETSAT